MKAWQKTLVALGSVLTPGMAMAGETANPLVPSFTLGETAQAVRLQEEAEVPDRISGFVGATATTAYISRWILLENQGFIIQPYAELDFALFDEKEGFVKSSYLFAGIWNSLHTHKEVTGFAGEIAGWYEFDWYVGIAATFSGGFSANLQYVEFLSPAQAFGSAKNLILNVAFDDSPYLGKFSVKPYAQVLYETSGKAGNGSDDQGIYLELGINPGMTLMEEGDYPVSLSLPAAIGLGFNDFYGDGDGDDEFFGGFRIGVAAGVPLAFMNTAGYGSWSASANLSYWYYGDGTQDLNEAAGAEDSKGDLIATVGVQCNF